MKKFILMMEVDLETPLPEVNLLLDEELVEETIIHMVEKLKETGGNTVLKINGEIPTLFNVWENLVNK